MGEWTISATVVVVAHFVILFSDDGRVRFCLRPFAVSIAAYVAVLPGCQDPELCTHLVSTPSTSSSYFEREVERRGGGETVPASIPVRGCSTLISAFFLFFKSHFKLYCGFGFRGDCDLSIGAPGINGMMCAAHPGQEK
jgi:hypothetical protein